jgi:hypothetical protein
MLTPSTATQPDGCRLVRTNGTLLTLGRVTAAVALAFTLIGFSPATTYAQAPECTVLELDPFAPTFLGCQGELVSVLGQYRQILCLKSDANGGFHGTLRTLAHGTGAAAVTTKKYSYNAEELEELQNPSSGTFEHTFVQNFLLIRQAENGTVPLFSDDDFVMKITWHLTVPPAGVPTAQVSNIRSECQ